MRNRWQLSLVLVATLTIGSVVFIPSVKAPPPYTITWAERASAPYANAQAGIIAGLDGKVYMMGGYAGGSPFSTARVYTPSTDSWATITSLPTQTRGPGIARDTNGLIYVLSGYSGLSDIANNQIYNPANDSWVSGTNVPTPVWMSAATTGSDGRIYLVGGETSGGGATNIVQIYDPQTGVWSSGTGMFASRKQFSVIALPSGLIFAIGGYNSGAMTAVEAYNLTSNSWSAKASLPSAVMVYGAALGPDGLIYVFGGSNSYVNNSSPYYATVYSYDPSSDQWFNTGTLPTPRRELSATTATNGRIYVVGGANGTYLGTNEEATLPASNLPPTASISSITPNPAQIGQTVTFTGVGSDSDGTIVAYQWRSSLSGVIGTQASFTRNDLPAGAHNIYFSVEDDKGAWSQEATGTLVVGGSGAGVQTLSLATMSWFILALVLAAVGVFVYYFVMVKKKGEDPHVAGGTGLPATPQPTQAPGSSSAPGGKS